MIMAGHGLWPSSIETNSQVLSTELIGTEEDVLKTKKSCCDDVFTKRIKSGLGFDLNIYCYGNRDAYV